MSSNGRFRIKAFLVTALAFAFGGGAHAQSDDDETRHFPKPRPGHLYAVAKTGVYDITQGGNMAHKQPWFDGNFAGNVYDGMEDICFRSEFGRLVTYITDIEPVTHGNTTTYHGVVTRNGIPWATGFGRAAGLTCSATLGPIITDLDSGQIWNVSSKGDYSPGSGKTPLATGLVTPFSVVTGPNPATGTLEIVSGGRDLLYSVPPHGELTDYAGIGTFLVGLTLFQTTDHGGGPGPFWLAATTQKERQVMYMPILDERDKLCPGPWNLLAAFPEEEFDGGFPNSLQGVGSTVFVTFFSSDRTENSVYRVVPGNDPELFAFGLPETDLGGLGYVHSCGDGVVEPEAEACDDAGDSALCNADCTFAECGDGVVNFAAGETCDDGNTEDDDACPNNCLSAAVVDATEAPSAPTTSGGCSIPSSPAPAGRAGAPAQGRLWPLLGVLGLVLAQRRRRARRSTTSG